MVCMYNLHPLFVHFPIALLFLYSILKVLPTKRLFPLVSWRQIERALLVFGVLGAFAALSSGETAEHLTRPDRQLVEAHAFFAAMATWLYGALLAGELLAIINPLIKNNLKIRQKKEPMVLGLLVSFEKLLGNQILSVCLAIVALVAIALTGLLGGVMVYGVSADPVAPMVLKLLGITL